MAVDPGITTKNKSMLNDAIFQPPIIETEIVEAAREMLAAIDGMYIEFVDRAEIVDKAERRLRAALSGA